MSIIPSGNAWISESQKSSSRVGKDVSSFCGRCKSNRIHTIVTLGEHDVPDRVQCNTCKSDHKFRAPRKEELGKNLSKRVTGGSMTENDEEIDLDKVDVSRVFKPDEPMRKRAKSKAKGKKSKPDDSMSSHHKGGATLPLSLQNATAEDLASYEAKMLGLKNNPSQVRDYRVTEKFVVGDVVNHKTFGTGFVVALSGANKVEIIFKVGRKLLVTAEK